MQQITQTKIINFFKKALLFGIIFFVATFLEIYWALGELSDKTSSSCLECNFLVDVSYIALITSILLSIFFLLTAMIKIRSLKIIIEFTLLISIWLLLNYEIFNDRYTGWSTFTFTEEINALIPLAFFPLLIVSLITIFIINKYFRFKAK